MNNNLKIQQLIDTVMVRRPPELDTLTDIGIMLDLMLDHYPEPTYRPTAVEPNDRISGGGIRGPRGIPGTGSGSGGNAGYGSSGNSSGAGEISDSGINKMLTRMDRKRRFSSEGFGNDGKYLYHITKWCFSKKSAEKVRTRVYALGQDRQKIERFRVIEDNTGFISMEMVLEIQFTEPGNASQFSKLIKLAGAQIKSV